MSTGGKHECFRVKDQIVFATKEGLDCFMNQVERSVRPVPIIYGGMTVRVGTDDELVILRALYLVQGRKGVADAST